MSSPAHEPSPPIAPYAAVSKIVFALVITIGLPFLLPGEPRINTASDRCAAQMRGITQTLILYAIDHDDQLPPPDNWRQLLIDAHHISEDYFDSPNHHDTETDTYQYVPATALDWSPEHVLLYHRIDLHDGGVHIAFHDGSVRPLPLEEARRILDSLARPDESP